ncbi:MAG: CPBP family intramembrane metalloprotease [Planctomycetota bacterium]|nr:CPBP family intramembrane metalloprotease [Planctomycetota bacterium]
MVHPSPAPVTRRIAVTAALLAFAALNRALLADLVIVWAPYFPEPFDEPRFPNDLLFLIEGLALCALTPRKAGLGLGQAEHWRRFAVPLAVVFALPPLLAATVYAHCTSRPFHGATWSMWLVQSAAQEFFFSGFVYARLSEVYGEPPRNWRGAAHPVLLLSALCFAVWHWPNVRWLTPSYMVFQFVYAPLGGWWGVQMRRWTGSLWPCVANHVLVNWMATVV